LPCAEAVLKPAGPLLFRCACVLAMRPRLTPGA
jgi:hypothetical protein